MVKQKVRIGWDERGLAIYKTIDTEEEDAKEQDSFQEENIVKTKVVTANKPAVKKRTKKSKK